MIVPPPLAELVARCRRGQLRGRLLAGLSAVVLMVPLVNRDLLMRSVAAQGQPPQAEWIGGSPVEFFPSREVDRLGVGAGRLRLEPLESGAGGPVGDWVTPPFRLGHAYLMVPSAEPAVGRETRWRMEVYDPASGWSTALERPAEDAKPREPWWTIPTESWQGQQARLRLTTVEKDSTAEAPTVGHPRGSDRRHGVQWVVRAGRTTYGSFAFAAAAVGVLLWLPGIAWRVFCRDRLDQDLAGLAVPGLLLLSGTGLLLWVTGSAGHHVVARAYLLVHVLLALAIALRPGARDARLDAADRDALMAYGALALGVLVLSILPLAVAYEGFAGTSLQSRLPLSAGDHAIPYVTAAYFSSGRDGKEASDRYFSPEWSVASRGPMPSLATVTLFNALGVAPPDPLGPSRSGFPAADDGFFIARIFGVLSNALVVLGAARLLAAVGGADAAVRRALLVWVGLAPVVVWNTLFVWPKMLAAFFVLLAAAGIVQARRPFITGCWCSLAGLSHPVGSLLAPALGLLFLQVEWRRSTASPRPWRQVAWRIGQLAAGGALLMGPWLAYKLWLGADDVFLRYPLGDGRGFERASSWVSWLLSRGESLWTTLVPGAYVFSSHALEWQGAPVPPPLRWVVQATKTLPGSIGLVMVPIACWALFRSGSAALRWLKRWMLLFAFVLMWAFWGYSSDGLGRNCLEPLSVMLIVVAVAGGALRTQGRKYVLALLAVESVTLLALSFLMAPTFAWEQATGPSGAAFTLAALVLVFPLVRWRGGALTPTSRAG